jgi:phosphatidylserine/phosphatidylglycerophosphate/cardiolipin synthase-like enzyme
MPQVGYRREHFIQALTTAATGKVRVFNLKPVGRYETYVHPQTWIFDDQYAIIGSANCCRRSFTHDSEVVAGLCDQGTDVIPSLWLPHQLRIYLWSKHLEVTESTVCNWDDGEKLWFMQPPPGHIQPNDYHYVEPLHPDYL